MQLVSYIDSWGQKRKGLAGKCENCQKEFITRKDKARTCCSKQCFNKLNKKSVEIICALCGKTSFRKKSKVSASRSGLNFCSRLCKDEGQKISNGIKEIWPDHFGTSDKNYRRIQGINKDSICCGCKLNKNYLLFVHHIDGDRENNKESNLEIVCANCHIKRHLRLEDGKWIYSTKYLTPRELLKDL